MLQLSAGIAFAASQSLNFVNIFIYQLPGCTAPTVLAQFTGALSPHRYLPPAGNFIYKSTTINQSKSSRRTTAAQPTNLHQHNFPGNG